MVKISSSQNGSALAIIVVILSTAIVGTLGHVLWNNSLTPKVNENLLSQEAVAEHAESDEIQKDPNDGYLVLQDWGIKFKLPKDFGEVRYYKESVSNENGYFEHYVLSTKRVEELGERCSPTAPDGPIRLSSISRTQTKHQEDQLHSAVTANNNEPIGGYYYYVSGGQSTCADEHTDWQTADNLMTFNILRSPIALN